MSKHVWGADYEADIKMIKECEDLAGPPGWSEYVFRPRSKETRQAEAKMVINHLKNWEGAQFRGLNLEYLDLDEGEMLRLCGWALNWLNGCSDSQEKG